MIAVGDSWSDASVLPGTKVFFEYLAVGWVCLLACIRQEFA